jgi:hypothetical protein
MKLLNFSGAISLFVIVLATAMLIVSLYNKDMLNLIFYGTLLIANSITLEGNYILHSLMEIRRAQLK